MIVTRYTTLGGDQARRESESRVDEEESMVENCFQSSSKWISALSSNIDNLLNSLQPRKLIIKGYLVLKPLNIFQIPKRYNRAPRLPLLNLNGLKSSESKSSV
jgi:hypothetical protein